MPDPSLFGHADAYRLYTSYAAKLEEAGLADRFPAEAELRHIVIEMLAERHAVEDVEEVPSSIDEAIIEAENELRRRRSGN